MNIHSSYTNVLMSQVLMHQDRVYLTGRFADTSVQAGNTLAAIETLLTEAGSDKSRLLSATIYLKDIKTDLETMDRIWGQWLPEGAAPIRAILEAKQVEPNILVEIAMTAAL